MAKLDVYIPSTPIVCEEGTEPRGLWLEAEESSLVEFLTTLAKARRFHNNNSDVQEFVICISLGGDDA